MLFVLLILFFLSSSSCQVCRTSVLKVRDVPETYHYTYYEAYQGADCLIWCTKSRLVTKTGIRMVQKMFNEFVDECCEGYVKDKTSSLNCQPTCNPPCENAICQHPNQCTCNPGYIFDSDNINTCIPRQPNNDSNNSNCPIRPTCEDAVKSDSLGDTTKIGAPVEDYDCTLYVKEQCCNKKFTMESSNSENENVYSHYTNNTGTNSFESVVKENNGTLNSNDTEIIVGNGSPFDYYEWYSSEPVCTDECNNCKCIADDIWVCEPGWYLNEDETECLPHCDACVHGVCKAPNICECFVGYHLSKLSTAQCIPDCNCSEGCLIPNVCVVNSTCQKCESQCENEEFIEPNLEIVKPTVLEEKGKSKSIINQDNRIEELVETDVISQETFKSDQSKNEMKLSGIPIHWVYMAVAIGLLFLIVLIFLINKKIKSKIIIGNRRKLSFIHGTNDHNNMTVHYTTTY